jgi:hypothetical protein
MTKFILPFIAFACILSAGSAHHTECDDCTQKESAKKYAAASGGCPTGLIPWVNFLAQGAMENLMRDLIKIVSLMFTSDWTPIMDTKTKGRRATISLPRTISLLLRTSTRKMSFQTTTTNDVDVSSGIESSPPLEKGTSELVKAIGDGGCCPWISSNIRFCEDYLNFNFSSSSSLRSIDNK